MDPFPEYTCPSCGEPIQIVVDPSGGDHQTYIEDCPVCCSPNELDIHIDPDGHIDVDARST